MRMPLLKDTTKAYEAGGHMVSLVRHGALAIQETADGDVVAPKYFDFGIGIFPEYNSCEGGNWPEYSDFGIGLRRSSRPN